MMRSQSFSNRLAIDDVDMDRSSPTSDSDSAPPPLIGPHTTKPNIHDNRSNGDQMFEDISDPDSDGDRLQVRTYSIYRIKRREFELMIFLG